MAEKRVAYQVNGRQFEGAIVYDDSVKTKRPAIFVQPDWKGVCADTIEQARDRRRHRTTSMLMADMFGKGYGDKPKAPPELRAGMTAVHKDLPFTIACGQAAYDALLAEADKLGLDRHRQEGGDRLLRRRRLRRSSRRAPARTSRRSWCSMSPIPIRSCPARPATSRAACWRSTAAPIR